MLTGMQRFILDINDKNIRIGVSVSSEFLGAKIRLEGRSSALEWKKDLKPGQPFFADLKQSPKPWPTFGVTVRVLAADGREILAYLRKRFSGTELPRPATEPEPPRENRD